MGGNIGFEGDLFCMVNRLFCFAWQIEFLFCMANREMDVWGYVGCLPW